MKNILLIINIVLLPFISFSQWSKEEPYQNLQNQINEFYIEQNISDTPVHFNYSVSQKMAQKYIDQNLEEIETVISLIKKSQEDPTKIRAYKKVVSNLSKITKQFLHKNYEKNKREYVFLYKNSIFQELKKNDKYYIYYILGQCNLSNSTKDDLLAEIDLPLIVRAKLNDEQASKSIIDSFLAEYLDTINYDEPKGEILADLLYLNNQQAFSVLDKVLSSNHVIYKEIDSTSLNLKIKPWNVISVNKYLFDALTIIYPYEIGFIKFLTYDPLKEINENQATLLFAKTLERYLTEKFDYKFTVSFKKNKLIDMSIYVPSPLLYNDEEYIRKFVYAFYGFNGELINITYDEAKQQVLNNWKTYYNQD